MNYKSKYKNLKYKSSKKKQKILVTMIFQKR